MDEEFYLNISDVEIGQILRALNLEIPDFLPVDLPTMPGTPLKQLNVPMEEITDLFLTYDPEDQSQSSQVNCFVGVKEVLEWCKECWAERKREEDEAKRQR